MQAFMKALLADVQALERMLESGLIESGVRRIGAEQEMFLVDRDLAPAPISVDLLSLIDSPNIGTELARFNLEANASPRAYGGKCLSELEAELRHLVHIANNAANQFGARVLLTGILPTLNQSHLTIENMAPNPRYMELNDALVGSRRGDFHIHLKGLDELQVTHDNVLVESCNTSFQVHFQVGPDEFANLYNLAQAVSAPVLAAAVNSPVLFGHRLWCETRVALFQHSVDSRTEAHRSRGHRPRVTFGESWVHKSVMELIREDIARYRVLLVNGVEEDSLEMLERGEIPRLAALTLHNGTVYRWNRFCYGRTNGVPHLRIENRALPAGPTIVDEVANAAFYFGLLSGLSAEHDDITRALAFDDVKNNFFAAARHGLKAQFVWEKGRSHTAESLITDLLLPTARAGLHSAGIDSEDIERYLGIIEERVKRHRTGACWIMDSLATMGEEGTPDLRFRTLTSAMLARAGTREPVHTWSLASLDEVKDWRFSFLNVGQVMSTELFTVRADDVVEMVANLMDWNHIRYVPVEDEEGRLQGLVTHRSLLRMVGRRDSEKLTVEDIMTTDLHTVTTETSTLDAIAMMRKHSIGCLPVLNNGRLVGTLTSHDFMPLSEKLIEGLLKEDRLSG